MRRLALIMLPLIAVLARPAGATHHTVYPDGSGDYIRIWDAISHAAAGDTILLGDGVFTGDGNRDITVIDRDLVVRSLSDDDTACIIDCDDAGTPHRAFFIDGGNLEIRGLMLRNAIGTRGGAVSITGGAVMFRKVRFAGNHATISGGGVFVDTGVAPQFVDCRFSDNTSDQNAGGVHLLNGNAASFSGCTFYNNHASNNGGAIHATSGESEFFQCRFYDNAAEVAGGALYSSGSPSPYFEGCSFYLNRSAGDGGAVYCNNLASPGFSDVSFTRNSADAAGAVLFARSGTAPEFAGCSMVGNSTFGASVVFCEAGAAPTLERCLIAWNEDSAAYAQGGATGISLGCSDIFANDNGDWANGIDGQLGTNGNIEADPRLCDPAAEFPYLAAGSPCLPENSACGPIGSHPQGCDNPTYYVDGYPGDFLETIQEALDLAPSGATVLLEQSSYSGPGNRDLNCYGKDLVIKPKFAGQQVVIDCEGSEAEPHRGFTFQFGETRAARLERLTFRNGYASYVEWLGHPGGGVYCIESSPSIVDCCFENCHAGTGGGIYVFFAASAPLVTGCVFDANVATGSGGGMHSDYASPQIDHCEFRNNVGSPGGGLFLGGGPTASLSDCLFDGNQTEGNTIFAKGGGLYLATLTSITVARCTFRNNLSDNGGAAYLYGPEGVVMDATLQECTLHTNSAVNDGLGGAIHATGPMNLHIDDMTVEDNTAQYGGGIYLDELAALDARALSLAENVAVEEGAGLYQSSLAGNLSLTDCEVSFNEIGRLDGGAGAGLWIGGAAALVDVDVHHNTLAGLGEGAGLYVAPDAAVDLTRGAVYRNLADRDGVGGGAYVDAGTFWTDGGEFFENTAGRGGALALVEAVSVFLDGSTLYDNTAVDHGGALYCRTSSPEVSGCTFVGNDADQGAHASLVAGSDPAFNSSILAFAGQGEAVFVDLAGGDPAFDCTDIFGNADGDWTPPFAGDLLVNGNLNADPLFCDLAADDFTLAGNSPCLPAGNDCGERIGAWGQGCDPTSSPDLPPVVTAYALDPAYPNPFNPRTTIGFDLPEPQRAVVAIYAIDGRRVKTLVSQQLPAGRHTVMWDGTNDQGSCVASGTYFYRVEAGPYRATRKMTLTK